MEVIPEAFKSASIAGHWEPLCCNSKIKKDFYKIYQHLLQFSMISVLISQSISLIVDTKSVDDFAEASYVFLTGVNGSIKSINLIFRKDHVIALRDLFNDKLCIPRNEDERKICSFYSTYSRYMVMSCMTLVECTAVSLAVWPFFFSDEQYALSLRAWYPYKIDNGVTYWLTQSLQMLALMTMANWNVSNDLTATSFMLMLCAQLELLSLRLKVLPDVVKAAVDRHVPKDVIRRYESIAIKQSVQHHLQIYRMKRSIEKSFAPGIMSQYCLSFLVICITIYELIENRSDVAQLFLMVLYLATMFMELLAYCWFGNEIITKSLQFNELICQGNWPDLHIGTMKSVLIIMLRASSPIRITCGPFITLSTYTFTGILKLSYSAFNVLQQSNI